MDGGGAAKTLMKQLAPRVTRAVFTSFIYFQAAAQSCTVRQAFFHCEQRSVEAVLEALSCAITAACMHGMMRWLYSLGQSGNPAPTRRSDDDHQRLARALGRRKRARNVDKTIPAGMSLRPAMCVAVYMICQAVTTNRMATVLICTPMMTTRGNYDGGVCMVGMHLLQGFQMRPQKQ